VSFLRNSDADLPIDLRFIDPIIDRVCIRYPFVDRKTIVFIIRGFFSVLRDVLLAGDTITIHNLFNHLHMIKRTKLSRMKLPITMIKLKTKTPKVFNG
jgi:hypothetical protein